MAWVTFTAAFDWTPPKNRRVTMAYKPTGQPVSVTHDCAEAAIAAGKAEPAETPPSPNQVRAEVGTPSVAPGSSPGAPPPPAGEE